jgi:hypothetical protein
MGKLARGSRGLGAFVRDSDYIPFPKFPERLPTIFSPEEVGHLIDSAANLFIELEYKAYHA